MDQRLNALGEACEVCGASPVLPSQTYCRRCGSRLSVANLADFENFIPGTTSESFDLPTEYEPLHWVADGGRALLVHRRRGSTELAKLAVSQGKLLVEPLPVPRGPGKLRAVVATRRGAFVASDKLVGVLEPTTVSASAVIPTLAGLLPDGPSIVGLATAACGDLFALTRVDDRLSLWAGSGMHPLRCVATAAGGPQTDCWMRLFVACETRGRGVARFWGGGRRGHVDLELGAMSIEPDAAAPDEPTGLDDRGSLHAYDHRPADVSSTSVVAVPAAGAMSWGLLSMLDGRFWPAPADARAPLALAAGDGAVVCQQRETTLIIRPAPSLQSLAVRRTALGRRIAERGVAATFAGKGFVAVDTHEGDTQTVVLYEFALSFDDPGSFFLERQLGSPLMRLSTLAWLPPLLVGDHLWLATVGQTGARRKIWRLAPA